MAELSDWDEFSEWQLVGLVEWSGWVEWVKVSWVSWVSWVIRVSWVSWMSRVSWVIRMSLVSECLWQIISMGGRKEFEFDLIEFLPLIYLSTLLHWICVELHNWKYQERLEIRGTGEHAVVGHRFLTCSPGWGQLGMPNLCLRLVLTVPCLVPCLLRFTVLGWVLILCNLLLKKAYFRFSLILWYSIN